jgi:ABC-type transport system involved in multi-copper enzyme maturation permease subunit
VRTLLDKEARELAPVFVFSLLSVTWGWAALFDFDSVLLQPERNSRFLAVLVCGLFGVGTGNVLFKGEATRGTENYLIHRAGGRSRVFFAKVLVGLAATLAMAVGPPVFYALTMWFISPLAPILQVERVVELIASGTIGIELFGVGVLVSQIRRSTPTPLLLFLGALGVTTFSWLLSRAVLSGAPVPTTLIHIAVGVLLLVASWRLFREPYDRDSAFPQPLHTGLLLLSSVLVILPVVILVSGIGQGIRSVLRQQYPVLFVDTADGTLFAAQRVAPGDDGQGDQMSGRFRPLVKGRGGDFTIHDVVEGRIHRRYLEVYEPARRPQGAKSPSDERAFKWLELDDIGTLYTMSDEPKDKAYRFEMPVYLDRASGTVRIFRYPVIDDQTHRSYAQPWPPAAPGPWTLLDLSVRRPDGQMFSPETAKVWRSLSEVPWRVPLLMDPGDQTLWSVDVRRPSSPVQRVRLPGNDELMGLEPICHERTVIHGGTSQVGFAVRGREGDYVWSGDRLVPFLPGRPGGHLVLERVVLAGQLEGKGLRVVLEDDPVAPVVRVVDAATDETCFTHEYGPTTPLQMAAALLVYASAVASPPSSTVPSFLGKGGDPLFTDGRHGGLLGTQLALTSVLALVVLRRFRRGAAGRWVTVLGLAWVVLGGLPGFLAVTVLQGRASPLKVRPAKSIAPLVFVTQAQVAS